MHWDETCFFSEPVSLILFLHFSMIINFMLQCGLNSIYLNGLDAVYSKNKSSASLPTRNDLPALFSCLWGLCPCHRKAEILLKDLGLMDPVIHLTPILAKSQRPCWRTLGCLFMLGGISALHFSPTLGPVREHTHTLTHSHAGRLSSTRL